MKKTALITRAYGVIGRAISEMMAEAGYALFLLGRDKEKMEKVGREIALHTGNPDIRSFGVDQSRKEMVKQFAASIDEKALYLRMQYLCTPFCD